MKIKKYPSIVFIIFLSVFNSFGQHTQKIDSLFTSWNFPNHPGGSIMVVKNNKTIFSKAYGLASIEYNVTNSTNTLFNIGSISKQFTAMGIVLLEEQNKLSFEDDVRKHLPELPDFGETITIRHLLHHTSGLRDLHGLLGLAGWRRNDLETNEDLYRIIKNQKELNFKPGEEFLYCNTGYILLAQIIERKSKSSFNDWMKKNIFDPLGMKNTYVEDQYDRVVANNTTSYYSQKEFKRAIESWGYFGSGNMHSTTKNINLWLHNFINPREKWVTAFNKLLSTTPLNNGYKTNYGFGVRIENHLEKKMIQHGGAVGGFRAVARVYPEEQLQIVILSNFSKSNIGSKIDKIAKIIFESNEKTQLKSITKKPQISNQFIRLSNKKLKQFEGIYWSDIEKIGRKVYVKNDTLRYSSSETSEWPLVAIGKNTFEMLLRQYENPIVKFDGGTHQMIITFSNGSPGIFEFLQSNQQQNTNDLTALVGDYYSSELKTTYSILLKESDIYCEHIRHGKIKIKQLYNNIFSGGWPIGIIEIERDKEGKVNGLRMSNGRTRNVWFKKVI
ncbi:serine hydrolase [Aquimarina sp. AU58]|uniref:serine hydrolase domain-containing protein n=1 Tax=Aquimarina sp. AU58 TaxID=1874112 RepID=UPI000D647788|nr:serine hydrolase domain-containing protein [Aquimarina sp. AU58]